MMCIDVSHSELGASSAEYLCPSASPSGAVVAHFLKRCNATEALYPL